jgi:peptidoglycan-associated lipoprotein
MTAVYRRRLGYCFAALLFCGAVAHGQSLGSAEGSLGYSYLRANAPPGQCGCFHMNGGSAEFAVGLSKGLSVVADIDGYHQDNVDDTNLGLWLVDYRFGLRYSYRRFRRWTPFAQYLEGVAHANGTFYGASPGSSGKFNGFAFSAGGGLDLNVTHSFALRLLQVEYLKTRLPSSSNELQNNLKIMTGVVWRFRP